MTLTPLLCCVVENDSDPFVVQPGSVADAALIAAGPAIGKGVGVTVKVLSRIPGVEAAIAKLNVSVGAALPFIKKVAKDVEVPNTAPPITKPVGDLRSLGLKDAHHVIQDAAVRDLPGYNTRLAPGVQLEGPSTLEGTSHFNATQAQRIAGGGTYGAERKIAYDALISAGYTDAQATRAIQEADAYFKSIGVTENTPTRIPGNRPR